MRKSMMHCYLNDLKEKFTPRLLKFTLSLGVALLLYQEKSKINHFILLFYCKGKTEPLLFLGKGKIIYLLLAN